MENVKIFLFSTCGESVRGLFEYSSVSSIHGFDAIALHVVVVIIIDVVLHVIVLEVVAGVVGDELWINAL